MRMIRKDDQHQIFKGNKQIGFVDEKDVLYGFHPITGYGVAICPLGNHGEIEKLLNAWLKLQK